MLLLDRREFSEPDKQTLREWLLAPGASLFLKLLGNVAARQLHEAAESVRESKQPPDFSDLRLLSEIADAFERVRNNQDPIDFSRELELFHYALKGSDPVSQEPPTVKP